MEACVVYSKLHLKYNLKTLHEYLLCDILSILEFKEKEI